MKHELSCKCGSQKIIPKIDIRPDYAKGGENRLWPSTNIICLECNNEFDGKKRVEELIDGRKTT